MGSQGKLENTHCLPEEYQERREQLEVRIVGSSSPLPWILSMTLESPPTVEL